MEASISFCRAMRASHHSACSFFAASGHLCLGFAWNLPFLPGFLERGVQLSRASGSSFACHFSQITSISALLAIDLSVMCGTRS